eukprot:TRINITY_DN107257_c0_g1_i4.p2 TRINITY_DN107257_c0_g1~~TRINITY_DN107257_c0_g1_i4.p2  ORF type:complete len:170 (+),score=35.01 TRINITY_DN107257_c0_g1_i4:98-607(+)
MGATYSYCQETAEAPVAPEIEQKEEQEPLYEKLSTEKKGKVTPPMESIIQNHRRYIKNYKTPFRPVEDVDEIDTSQRAYVDEETGKVVWPPGYKPKFWTAPYDPRFPSTNQARHCYVRYCEWYKCLKEKGDEEDNECKFYRDCVYEICPGDWLERWEEQRENGIWPGKY